MKHFEYNKSFYNKRDLKYFAKLYLEFLPKDVTGLVSMGSSGCTIASAMLLLHNKRLNHYYIRKENEESHEHMTYIYNSKTLAIVDDFISSGKTIINICERLKTYAIKPKYILVLKCPKDLIENEGYFKELVDEIKVISIMEELECHSWL